MSAAPIARFPGAAPGEGHGGLVTTLMLVLFVGQVRMVTFPAVLPQVITALRVSYGIAWVVIVAAEMVGCQDGLGYGIWEARNGLRLDSAVCYMMVIGLLGMGIDRLLYQLTKLPNVRWGYER